MLATLHASETSIYRRFGFGLATDSVAAVVTTRQTKPWRSVAAARIDPTARVHRGARRRSRRSTNSVARWRVGSISRPAWMWPRILKDASQPTAEPYGKGSFVAVHTDPTGADDGYVYYDVDWDESFAKNPTGRGKVRDLWGASPEVELELWRFLLDIDLITTWKAEVTPGRRTRPAGDARLACVRGASSDSTISGSASSTSTPHWRRGPTAPRTTASRSASTIRCSRPTPAPGRSPRRGRPAAISPPTSTSTSAPCRPRTSARVSWQRPRVDRRGRPHRDETLTALDTLSPSARPRSAAPATDLDHPRAMSGRPESAALAHRRRDIGGDQGPEKMPSLMSSWRDMYSAFGS